MRELTGSFVATMNEIGRRLMPMLEDVLTRFATMFIVESLHRRIAEQVAETEEETRDVIGGIRWHVWRCFLADTLKTVILSDNIRAGSVSR